MSMVPSRLLAKSLPHGMLEESAPPSVFLQGHLEECYLAARVILDATGEDQLKALGLSPEKYLQRFRKVVLLSIALHDLGKANDHFQGIVQQISGRNGRLQGLRHEWVAILVLGEPRLKEWFSKILGANDTVAMFCAISGHHPGLNRQSPPREPPHAGEGSEILFYGAHPDFQKCLTWLATTFDLGDPPNVSNETIELTGGNSAFDRILSLFKKIDKQWRNLDEEERRFVAAVKACVLASDVAGSALPKTITDGGDRLKWLKEAFSRIPTSEQIGTIVSEGLRDEAGTQRPLRPFQESVAKNAGEVTFVRAGCGSGKTIAAWNWAYERCPGKRLYFCYPTTGTATEGFRDYLFDPIGKEGMFGAELFHGRAEVDLDLILDVEHDKGSRDETDEAEKLLRIESLNAWSTPIVSCTVDTVLCLLQNHRRGLYAWPALAGAAFIFDEIHSYDERLFGALLNFLGAMRGIPILLMTASLPQKRVDAIQAVLRQRKTSLALPERTRDLLELEERPRYHRLFPDGDPMKVVRAEISAGGKVLWVCNTVNRAIEAADTALEENLDPIIYHSRFRYEDRVWRHKEVIDAFRSGNPALAISTQVAEMSLDLSATLLVTDRAPVPAMIQRLGRLNRYARPGDATRPFLVVEPTDREGRPLKLPYGDGWWETSLEWLNALPECGITQSSISECWETLQRQEQRESAPESAWLHGGPVTQTRLLRELSPGISVILERDLVHFKRGAKRLSEIVLPMPSPPKTVEWRKWKNVNGIPVAPEGSIRYDGKRGAQWEK